MVNKTLIAARAAIRASLIHLKFNNFQNWHGPRNTNREPPAWESGTV